MARKMLRRKVLILLLAIILTGSIFPALVSSKGNSEVEWQLQRLASRSIESVDKAISVLSKGWTGMTPAEQLLFNKLYDPGGTGDVDDSFISEVLANYRRVRGRLSSFPAAVFKTDSSRCQDQRLYYTDLVKIYVCPYFNIEENVDRKARVLIHEAVHMALVVGDRPYFHKNTYSTRYQAMTPRGPWTAAIPLVGPLFRELAHSDTLNHPDAYAWFAFEL